MSMMGGTASVPGRGNARLQLRSPSSIAVYDSYEDAQHAVDYLADRSFPVQFLSIVGTELKSVERITGGLSWGRVLAGAAMNGLVWGVMAALLFYFFVPNVSVALLFLGAIVVFVLANMFTSAISYAMTGGRRDFTSSSQIIATRYEVLGENEVAGQARQLLAGGRPARTVQGATAPPAASGAPGGGRRQPAYGRPGEDDLSNLPAPDHPSAPGRGGAAERPAGGAFDPTDRSSQG